MMTNRYTFQSPLTTVYNAGGTSTGATPARPYKQSITMNDFPRNIARESASIKVDWRPAPIPSELRPAAHGMEQQQHQSRVDRERRDQRHADGRGRRTAELRRGLHHRADGPRSLVSMAPTMQTREQPTVVANVNYRFDDGRWKIDASASSSNSRANYRNFDHHRFYSANIAMRTPFRVTLQRKPAGLGEPAGTNRIFNNANQELSLFDIENYQLTVARDHEFNKKTELQIGRLDVKRRLGGLPVPASVQIGGMQSRQSRDATWKDHNYTFNGGSLAPYVSDRTWDAGVPGYAGFPFVSMNKLYNAWQQNPSLFHPDFRPRSSPPKRRGLPIPR